MANGDVSGSHAGVEGQLRIGVGRNRHSGWVVPWRVTHLEPGIAARIRRHEQLGLARDQQALVNIIGAPRPVVLGGLGGPTVSRPPVASLCNPWYTCPLPADPLYDTKVTTILPSTAYNVIQDAAFWGSLMAAPIPCK